MYIYTKMSEKFYTCHPAYIKDYSGHTYNEFKKYHQSLTENTKLNFH